MTQLPFANKLRHRSDVEPLPAVSVGPRLCDSPSGAQIVRRGRRRVSQSFLDAACQEIIDAHDDLDQQHPDAPWTPLTRGGLCKVVETKSRIHLDATNQTTSVNDAVRLNEDDVEVLGSEPPPPPWELLAEAEKATERRPRRSQAVDPPGLVEALHLPDGLGSRPRLVAANAPTEEELDAEPYRQWAATPAVLLDDTPDDDDVPLGGELLLSEAIEEIPATTAEAMIPIVVQEPELAVQLAAVRRAPTANHRVAPAAHQRPASTTATGASNGQIVRALLVAGAVGCVLVGLASVVLVVALDPSATTRQAVSDTPVSAVVLIDVPIAAQPTDESVLAADEDKAESLPSVVDPSVDESISAAVPLVAQAIASSPKSRPTSPATSSNDVSAPPPVAPWKARGMARIMTRSSRGTFVRVDGKRIGPVPQTIFVKPGRHRVTFENATLRRAVHRDIETKPGRTVELHHWFR